MFRCLAFVGALWGQSEQAKNVRNYLGKSCLIKLFLAPAPIVRKGTYARLAGDIAYPVCENNRLSLSAIFRPVF